MRLPSGAPIAKEVLEQSGGFCFPESLIDLGAVMAGRLVEDPGAMFDAAALRIAGGIVEAPDTRERYRAGAHRAGFESDVEIAPGQPLILQHATGGPDCENFGMSRRIVQRAGAVAGNGENAAVTHDDGPDRNFALARRFASGIEGQAEGVFVGSGAQMPLPMTSRRTARRPISRRQNPSGQSILAIAA